MITSWSKESDSSSQRRQTLLQLPVYSRACSHKLGRCKRWMPRSITTPRNSGSFSNMQHAVCERKESYFSFLKNHSTLSNSCLINRKYLTIKMYWLSDSTEKLVKVILVKLLLFTLRTNEKMCFPIRTTQAIKVKVLRTCVTWKNEKKQKNKIKST